MMLRLSVLAFVFVLALATPVSAATVPAITAFEQSFASMNDYTVTVQTHEVLGTQTQDRVYNYWFKKPHQAKTLIVSGPGAGGTGVWNGGDRVSGHPGGMPSFIQLKVGLHDARATTLRGYTIVNGLLQNVVAKYTKVPGKLTERPGPVIDGQPTEVVELLVTNPAKYDGVSRGLLYFSTISHFPVRQLRYAGGKMVTEQNWTSLRTNVGLTDSDFPF